MISPVGTWKLLSFQYEFEDSDQRDEPLGANPVGYLVLTEERLITLMTTRERATDAAAGELLDGMIGADFDDPTWWRRGWVPFTESFNGDHYCVDIEAEGGGTPCQVIDFWHDEPTRNVLAPSLADWFRGLVVTMEEGRLDLA